MLYLVISVISLMILMSIWQFVSFTIKNEHEHMHRIGMSFQLFYTLLMIYVIVIIGFGLMYFILNDYMEVLMEIEQVPNFTVLVNLFGSFYLIGVTMLTIGYE